MKLIPFLAVTLLALTTLQTGVRAESPSKPLFVAFIGGFDSEPTADQLAGKAQRGVGNSGLFQLAGDLRQEGVATEYFNWNGSAAGKIKDLPAPLSKGIAQQLRKRHAEHPQAMLAIVGNSWGGHTAWEVSQLLAEEPAVPLDLVVFLDPSSVGRFDKSQPEKLPSNVRHAVTLATRNALGWKKWANEPRAEFVDLGDPANGFLKNPGPAYDSLFDVNAHIAAEWDAAIHKSIQTRLLKVVTPNDSKPGDPFLTIDGQAGLGKGQHIVFVTGEEYYRSEEGLSMFAKIMARHHGFRCTVLFAIDPASGQINPNRNNNIPGLAALGTADLMVIFARFRELPDADMKHIVDYVNAGKPVLGIRNATHAFRYSPQSTSPFKSWDWQSKEWVGGFGQQILGDTWIAHYGQFQKEATLAHVNLTQRNHPVLQGVADTIFCHTDVNSVNRLTAKDVVLFHGQVLSGLKPTDPPVTDNRKETRMPFAWFKTYTAQSGKQGRSFTTTAGASLDWLNEDLRRLMVNAMLSLTGHEKEIPDQTNVSFIDDYKPKPTGAIADSVWATEKLTPASFAIKNSKE